MKLYGERRRVRFVFLVFKDILSAVIVVFIGGITSQGSNHLPHNLRYDVLTTTERRAVVNKGEK